MSDDNLLRDILLKLDIACFQWSDSVFFPVGDLPDWFTTLYQARARPLLSLPGKFLLDQVFPFIEHYMVDALAFWENNTVGMHKSGIWTEQLDEFNELNLEAIAINSSRKKILLISNETRHFTLRRKVFQKARNMALSNERLESSLQLHQRQLQLQIEEIYQRNRSLDDVERSVSDESTAVVICKQDGSVELFNKALFDIYPVSKKDGKPKESLLKKWSSEAELLYPEIHRALTAGQHWEGEFETEDHQQQKRWVRLMIAPIMDDKNLPQHYVCIANDISNIKLSEREIELLIQLDPNTHLPNRRYFWSQLEEQIKNNEANGEVLSVIYIDLDHFKQINNELGPKQGDLLLKAVANRLRQSVKKDDFIAHLGGDEFAVIVNRVCDEDSLRKIADRIKSNICRDIVSDGVSLNVSVSMGIASYPKHGLKPHLLVRNADYAMFHAKEMGRNQYQFSNPYSHRHIKRKIYIEQGLKHALVNHEFQLVYQPQISLNRLGEHRIEALIRWHHPEHGILSPADFISIAEESGLIIDIGRWVLEKACDEAQRLKQHGYGAKVSVNVSPKQFQNATLVNDVRHALQEFNIDPKQLELEVTESLFLHNLEESEKQLHELKTLGVTIALDDFGTGFSSLNYLKNLPIDILKIDRSFIQELPNNQHSRTIVESVISMSHQLSIEVIAEGIENQQQLDYLKQLSCDYVQGFLFHAPLTSDELIELYQSLAPIGNKGR